MYIHEVFCTEMLHETRSLAGKLGKVLSVAQKFGEDVKEVGSITGHPNAEKEHHDGDISSCLGFLRKDGGVGGKNHRRPET